MRVPPSIGAALLLLVSSACSASDVGRPANSLELSYVSIAIDRSDAALCNKIAPDAYKSGAMNPRGLQIVLARSKCFFEVAARRQEPALCEHVRPISTPFLDGSSVTAEACRAAANSAAPPRYFIDYGGRDEPVLRLLGYMGTDEVLSIDEVLHLYSASVTTPEFGQRAARLPDFSQGDLSAERELLELAPNCTNGASGRHCEVLRCALLREGIFECFRRIDPLPI